MSVQDDVIFIVVKYTMNVTFFLLENKKMSRRKRGTKTLVGPIRLIRQVSAEHILRGAANMRPQYWDNIAIIAIAHRPQPPRNNMVWGRPLNCQHSDEVLMSFILSNAIYHGHTKFHKLHNKTPTQKEAEFDVKSHYSM